MNILRLTRHEPSREQISELMRIYGNGVNVVTVCETVPDAKRVAELVEEHKADVLEVVLPIGLLAEVLKTVKVPVIRAVMLRELKEDGTVEFIFDHYERVVKVEVVTERL